MSPRRKAAIADTIEAAGPAASVAVFSATSTYAATHNFLAAGSAGLASAAAVGQGAPRLFKRFADRVRGPSAGSAEREGAPESATVSQTKSRAQPAAGAEAAPQLQASLGRAAAPESAVRAESGPELGLTQKPATAAESTPNANKLDPEVAESLRLLRASQARPADDARRRPSSKPEVRPHRPSRNPSSGIHRAR